MEQSKSYGAVIASIVIILVLIVGALYFWGRTLEQKEPATQETTQQENTVEATSTVDDSVESLKTDINASADLKDVDAGLKQI